MNDNKICDMWETKEDPKCSFCKTPKSKAKNMIKSELSDHYICDKCIKQGIKLVANNTLEK